MIHVEGLTKYYGAHAAIRNLSFDIAKGEVVGVLGLNGAGKSTTLRILGCVLLPTSGRVVIDGHEVTTEPHEIRKRIGFLPDTPPLYDEMTVSGYLRFVAELRGVSKAELPSKVETALASTALSDMGQEPIGTLSHGYRQRVGVAQAIVHQPAVIILDEPTSGLDPVQIVEMRALVRRLKERHTVLVSSHILSEISQTCDRLLVIQGGELVAQGTEDELSSQAGGGRAVRLTARGDAAALEASVKSVPGVTSVRASVEAGLTVLRIEASSDVRGLLARAVTALPGADLLGLQPEAGRLESIFLQLTRKEDRS